MNSGWFTERRLLTALGLLAIINLAIALFVIATQPWRASDLLTMYGWCSDWLRRGSDLYSRPDAFTDYPPNAIVTLSPMALIPGRWLVPAWTVFSLVLAPLLPFVVSRAAGNRSRDVTLLAIAAFLCWASARTLLQFSVLSMTLAFAAAWLADARPSIAGLLLGLALAKPHIAGPVALWALFGRRGRLVAVACAAIVVEWAIYCAHAHVPPLATIQGYWHVLVGTYGGPDGLVGVTSLRQWVTSDAAWLVIAGALLIVPITAAIRWRHATGPDRLIAPACASLWSLLAIYHNSNNLILVLPAFVYLLSTGNRWAVIALQAALMVDIPFRLAPFFSANSAIHATLMNANRILVVVTFACLAGFAWLRRPAVEPV